MKRYIVSSAQNNTKVHSGVWTNLLALAKHYDATVLVARYHYETRFHKNSAKPGATADEETTWFDPAIAPYVADQRITLAPGLEWCGEVQILPTAKRPISGFEAYTGRNSCILPHAKFAMQSIASGKHEGTKLVYTSGTATKRNYLQKKAGMLAEFHHGFGGLVVEVDAEGNWFVRQLNADNSGAIHDLDVKVSRGKVTTKNRVTAIVWGDCHVRRGDPTVAELAWGKGGMLETLRPRHQVFHDLLDFRSRNHHEIDSGHRRFERHSAGAKAENNVQLEIGEAARALIFRSRYWCRTVVVASNHDEALTRWLDTVDYREDPENALFFLHLQGEVYKAIARRKPLHVFEYAMRYSGAADTHRFLCEDESYIVCPDANGGIELGMHGHRGPNGTRGNANNLARMGRKAIVGHSHSAAIVDGVYVTGTSSDLDMGYNKGPSSWTHSHVVVYPNGKRAVVTMWKAKWRA